MFSYTHTPAEREEPSKALERSLEEEQWLRAVLEDELLRERRGTDYWAQTSTYLQGQVFLDRH